MWELRSENIEENTAQRHNITVKQNATGNLLFTINYNE